MRILFSNHGRLDVGPIIFYSLDALEHGSLKVQNMVIDTSIPHGVEIGMEVFLIDAGVFDSLLHAVDSLLHAVDSLLHAVDSPRDQDNDCSTDQDNDGSTDQDTGGSSDQDTSTSHNTSSGPVLVLLLALLLGRF